MADSRQSFASELAAAGRDEPLPAALRDRLLAIASADLGEVEGDAPPLPAAPVDELPPSLRGRLLAIPRLERAGVRPPLPAHLRSPLWSVAASYVVASLLLLTVGDPLRWGRGQLDELWRGVGGALPTAALALPTASLKTVSLKKVPITTALPRDMRQELRELRELGGAALDRLERDAAAGRAWAEDAAESWSRRAAARVAAVTGAWGRRPKPEPDPETERTVAGDESPRPAKENDDDR